LKGGGYDLKKLWISTRKVKDITHYPAPGNFTVKKSQLDKTSQGFYICTRSRVAVEGRLSCTRLYTAASGLVR
jgi:hypothetical protein